MALPKILNQTDANKAIASLKKLEEAMEEISDDVRICISRESGKFTYKVSDLYGNVYIRQTK